MSKAQGYSLWLIPTGETYDRLNNIIVSLSKRYKTQYFEPHVTLVGGILGSEDDVISKTSQLTALLHPHMIELSRIDFLNEYFRCLFVKARETAYVMSANQLARGVYGQETIV